MPACRFIACPGGIQRRVAGRGIPHIILVRAVPSAAVENCSSRTGSSRTHAMPSARFAGSPWPPASRCGDAPRLKPRGKQHHRRIVRHGLQRGIGRLSSWGAPPGDHPWNRPWPKHRKAECPGRHAKTRIIRRSGAERRNAGSSRRHTARRPPGETRRTAGRRNRCWP